MTTIRSQVDKVKNWLAFLHPDHRAIARGFLFVSVFVLLGKLVAAVKEVAVAFRYGLSAELDAYLFVFNLVSWPPAVLTSVASLVLVPLFAQRFAEDSLSARKFAAEILAVTIVIGVLTMFLVAFVLKGLIHFGLSGLPGNAASLAQNMVFPLALCVPLGLVVGIFSARIMSSGAYLNTLLEAVPAAVICLALLLVPSTSIVTLIWATVLGTFAHTLVLGGALSRRSIFVAPSFIWTSDHWPQVASALTITLGGQLLMSATGVVDQFFAARLETGAIATMSYANRLTALILGIGAVAVSRATLPVFSRLDTKTDGHLRMLARRWFFVAFTCGLLLAGVFAALAPWLVEVAFQRGAFNARDTLAVSAAFRFNLIQIPIYFGGMVLLSVMASRRQHRSIAIIAALVLVSKLTANALLVPRMGVNGLMLANTLMYAVSVTGNWFAVRSGWKK